MRTTIISLAAAAALALPAAAFAHGGDHHGGWHHGWNKDAKTSSSSFAKLTGTGSTLGASTSTATGTVSPSGTFSATVTTDWSKAMSKTFTLGTVACAPATASLTLNGASTSAALTGKTCSWTPAGGTAVYGFFGTDPAKGVRLVLKQAPSGAVAGVAFVGVEPMAGMTLFSKNAAHAMAGCGH